MPDVQASEAANQRLPPALVRRYEVLIMPRKSAKALKMREVQSASIGHLVTVRVSLTQFETVPLVHRGRPR